MFACHHSSLIVAVSMLSVDIRLSRIFSCNYTFLRGGMTISGKFWSTRTNLYLRRGWISKFHEAIEFKMLQACAQVRVINHKSFPHLSVPELDRCYNAFASISIFHLSFTRLYKNSSHNPCFRDIQGLHRPSSCTALPSPLSQPSCLL